MSRREIEIAEEIDVIRVEIAYARQQIDDLEIDIIEWEAEIEDLEQEDLET